jgi:hypothetical protein
MAQVRCREVELADRVLFEVAHPTFPAIKLEFGDKALAEGVWLRKG